MNSSPGCGSAFEASHVPFTETESPTVICSPFFPSTWTSVIFTWMSGFSPRGVAAFASRFSVAGAVVVVVVAGDSDVEVAGAFVVVAGDSDVEAAGAFVVVAGAFVVVAGDSDVDSDDSDSDAAAGGAFVVEVAGVVVVAVSPGSAEATGASENDVKTRVRAMKSNPSVAHRDTTPSPALRRKTRLRMGYTFRCTHKCLRDVPDATDLARRVVGSDPHHSVDLFEDRERLATTPDSATEVRASSDVDDVAGEQSSGRARRGRKACHSIPSTEQNKLDNHPYTRSGGTRALTNQRLISDHQTAGKLQSLDKPVAPQSD